MIQFEKNSALKKGFQELRKSMEQMQSYLSALLPYMEEPLTKDAEAEVLSLLSSYGICEPDLRLPMNLMYDHPYFKNIHLDDIVTSTVFYEETLIERRKLMNTDFMKPLGRYLFHYHPIGYFEEDLRMPALKEGKTVWMSPALSEFRSMEEGIQKGFGKCLTFGLGIGLIVYMWLMKDEVSEVTIVEHNKDVITLFKEKILPQFPQGKPVHIIEGDAVEYFTEDFLEQFDYVYADFWESTEDGLPLYTRLMEKDCTAEHVDYWIEDSILIDLKYLIVLYLQHLYEGNPASDFVLNQDFSMVKYAMKVHLFFQHLDVTLRTEEELLHFIHSKKILKSILSI